MSTGDFLLVYGCSLAAILVFRCVPIFVLKGRQLPERVSAALGFIPAAAFAALVANDLFSPGMFSGGFWPAAVPLVAAAVVVVVALRTRSLVWCAVVGIVAYALLTLIA